MSVNSFENYPMSWKPEKAKLKKPYYLSIALKLELDILSGNLGENEKMPPQRELADYLDLNLSTITRAYKICELKGLLYAVTGRGTFVSPAGHTRDTFFAQDTSADKSGHVIEMGMIKPFYQNNQAILYAAKKVLVCPDAVRFFEYSNPLGTKRQIGAASKWLDIIGVRAEPENILLAAGAQNALSVILVSLFAAGDKIAVDEYTYTNFKGLANFLHIQLIAVDTDKLGMSPDALINVCKQTDLKGIYLMPTCSNPTGIFMPACRRNKIAEIMRTYNLILIEDDIYSFLAPGTVKPIYFLAPERTIHICSISKSLCPGLRVAFIAFPEKCRERLVTGMLSMNLKTVSLNAEIIAELIDNGQAEEIVRKKIESAKRRNEIFRMYFPDLPLEDIQRFFHWIRLPDGLSSEALELSALQNGVHVLGSHRFAMKSNNNTSYIRISVTSPDTEEDLKNGLQTLKNILKNREISFIV